MIVHKLLQKNRVLLLTLAIVANLLLYAPPAWAGDHQWSAIGPTGGQIYVLAVDPTTPTTLYAGMYGGVFKSTNGGGTWTPINTGLTNRQVWSLVIDPATPDTLYAGTWGGGVFVITFKFKPVFLPIILRD